ncbi:uncharacterized protein EV420DRAFT_504531 [Desarmillaria tabescens]|uniref:Uncharacterized protein n=1 Tax=Armillaria tabescens TaxID=1929756 RepID=A0AA39N4Z4_ARMTA|nr:uncharacterized protein EV420DRAFT_504531 [Desarmillaria tabescens]KAK0457609.1 hypothetical protein EV420DRAFT_504531 [Desarmillaria tabescens]
MMRSASIFTGSVITIPAQRIQNAVEILPHKRALSDILVGPESFSAAVLGAHSLPRQQLSGKTVTRAVVTSTHSRLPMNYHLTTSAHEYLSSYLYSTLLIVSPKINPKDGRMCNSVQILSRQNQNRSGIVCRPEPYINRWTLPFVTINGNHYTRRLAFPRTTVNLTVQWTPSDTYMVVRVSPRRGVVCCCPFALHSAGYAAFFSEFRVRRGESKGQRGPYLTYVFHRRLLWKR